MALLSYFTKSCELSSRKLNLGRTINSISSNKLALRQLSSNDTKQESKPPGWLDRVLAPKRIETGNKPHSRLLAGAEFIYEMHFHDSIPSASDTYVKKYERYSKELIDKSNNKAILVGSFRVEIGNQDQFVHIWRYPGNYKQASEVQRLIHTDPTLKKLCGEHLKDLRKRESQFMMSFSFWDHPKPEVHNSFYEMRSYLLKPGTMIDWANGWSRGIKHRDNGVAGFFSQIGQMYTVHHIWRYEDLQVRKDVRENSWRTPGWDECVSLTVPNIVNLTSRWMSPNEFSPLR